MGVSRKVRIAIAAWHLRDFNVGLGRYGRALIEAIGRVDRENHYEILMPDDSCRFPARPNMRYRLIRFPIFKRRFWEQVAPLLSGSHDLLHLPYDSCVAWKRGKLVVTIHDVKPLLFGSPSQGRNVNSMVERFLVRDKWGRIDHVLTDSHCSRRDIVGRLGVREERVTVVYPGVEPERFCPAKSGPVGLGSGRPYVLCVAGADPTKNVGALVEAFAKLPLPIRGAHDLVLAGDFRRRVDLHEQVKRTGIEKQTVFTGVVSDDRLIELYQQAVLFVFPSLYEGFGFPVLEAMACGCPVISSNASSLPEVAGDAALLVDPTDVEGLSGLMKRVLTDGELRRDLRARGLDRAAEFSWDRTARETIAVYRRVVGEVGGEA
ncbi:MAG: glycosyltransferase family 1 protein [Nitrospirae bacterium]|nr:MAG: glycosyltransferase family 1 protein [Nitrospirota bacterium]